MGKTYLKDWSYKLKEKKHSEMRMPASEQVRMGSRGSPFGSAMIEYKNMKFLIMDRPSNSTISRVVEELKKHEAHDLVRVCEPTYSTDLLVKEGINVLDWYYDDGAPPPKQIIDEWLKLVKKRFKEYPGSCVAVHCVAGLGRAPMLVALALIESGMKYEDAVEYIRKKRRGAINTKQLSYLETYKPSKKLKDKESSCCIQ